MTGAQETRRPRRYELDCRHVLWLIIPPLQSDVLWCSPCQSYQPLLLSEGSKYAELYDAAGEFKSQRISSRSYKGTCLKTGCDYTVHKSSYQSLINEMHRHHMRGHTKWTIKRARGLH